jgi:CRP-like cAMP-binding protein
LVRTHGFTTSFRSNELICRPSEQPEHVYLILSGWAYRYRRLDDGSRQILRFLIPGDLSSAVSLFKSDRATSMGIRAVTDMTAGAIEVRQLREFMAHSESLRAAVFDELCDQVVDLEQRLTDIGVCSAPSRVAQLLMDLHRRLRARGLADETALPVPLRQEDLARAIGLTPVHVNRTLRQLQRLGWINYERGRMHLLSLECLQRVASEPTRAFVDSISRELAKPTL